MTLILRPEQDELLQRINNLAADRYDVTASPNEFVCAAPEDENSDEPKYLLKGQEIGFSQSAIGQLLIKIKIPAAFYNRCPAWLKIHNLTYFNNQHKNNYLFRMEPDHNARATLSDSYGVIDDKDLFPLLFENLANRSDIALRKFQQDPYITQLAIDFTDAVGEYNGEAYCAGLLITNSETGHSAVWIEPVVHIPSCSFVGRNVLKRQGIDCRIIHRGQFPAERVLSLINQAKDAAQVGIVQLAEAFNKTIDTKQAITFARNVENLPNRFVQILEEEWENQHRIARAEAARRIINLAQELPLFQRIQVEQKAGDFIGLFDHYQSRFSEIIKEIQNDD